MSKEKAVAKIKGREGERMGMGNGVFVPGAAVPNYQVCRTCRRQRSALGGCSR